MLQTEFIRSLQSNYERILLQQKPDEKRYQYCILTRGGIKGLLPCSLRYINGQVYLYYDITSRQNVAQFCRKQKVNREWVRDFFDNYFQVRQELGRFLLDEKNILVFPEQIFQDLGKHSFFFLYLPYYEEDNGFTQLFDFMIEHLDYDDDLLVECIYKMYEQYEKNGEIYLQEKIFEDAEKLEIALPVKQQENGLEVEESPHEETEYMPQKKEAEPVQKAEIARTDIVKNERKGFFGFLGNKKKQNTEARQSYYEDMMEAMEGRAVAEEPVYEDEEYGKTVYMETPSEDVTRKLYTPDGRVAMRIDKDVIVIGKQKEEVDLVLEDESVSRLHARIFVEDQMYCLEDLNSTNGTFKNGLHLQPYEKRRLEEGDEIKFGKILLIFR